MRKATSPIGLMVFAAATGAAGVFGFSHAPLGGPVSAALSGCAIKGNISINTGERIYHVPSQLHYDETIISPQYGERWFCSEAQARAAGWRKSRV
jgi:hypothetical protein